MTSVQVRFGILVSLLAGTHAIFTSPRCTGGIRIGSTGAQGAVDVQVTDCTIERGGSVLPAGPGILFQVR